MKKGIHPEYKKAKITCGCGNVIETKNTAGDLTVEICSACHPFFTGKQKLLDTAGRVDKFRARMETANALKNSKAKVKKTDATNIDKETRLRENATDGQAVDIKPTSDVAQVEKKDETSTSDVADVTDSADEK